MKDWIKRVIAKIGIDKIAHFFGSAFLTLAFCRLFPVWDAAFLAAALGALKESFDDKVDWRDLLADGLGIIVSVIIMLL